MHRMEKFPVLCAGVGVVALLLSALASDGARAAAGPGPGEVPRRVLVLYDSQAGQSPRENLCFASFQMVLNHCGLIADYRDVDRRPLPDGRQMQPYAGVMTTFMADVTRDPVGFLGWLTAQGAAGRRLVILGSIGATIDARSDPALTRAVTRVYRHIGVDYHPDRTLQRPLIRYGAGHADRAGFERSYPALPPVYEKLVPVDPAVNVLMSLVRTDRPDSLSAAVAVGPGGGYALDGYLLWQDPLTFRRQWYLDPFDFVTAAFGCQALPVPDTTTLNGLRIGFSHIDADGFSGPSRIAAKTRCAEVIRDRVLKRFAYPVSVSVITGEIDPSALGNEELVALAREIFALPNVESASHSYSHPFYWDPEDLDEAAKYPHQYGIPIPGYTHDRKAEIDGSVAYITRALAPPHKPCKLFFWSGNCLPTEADMARTAAIGVLNINGGDTLFDEVNDSYTSVAPVYRQVGRYYQFFTGQANENILTNLWTGPFYGFREIITTMERTGAPRRVAPVDIYYHFYSGEYPASIKAVETVYEWALRQDLARLFTSEYLSVAADWLRVEIARGGPARFTIRRYGQCRTVRLAADGPLPDLARSVNVLGFVSDPQGCYVSLAAADAAELVLTDPAAAAAAARRRPHLRRASGWIDAFAVSDAGVRLVYRGHGQDGWIDLGGLPAGRRVAIDGDALAAAAPVLAVDSAGRLRVDALSSGALEVHW